MTAPDPLKRGFLFLLDKPEGLTSHDVVERVRKATGVARIGHSGTLDPMATGLLLLCAGGAARLQGFFTLMDKSYEGTIRLGRATATYDREGDGPRPRPRRLGRDGRAWSPRRRPSSAASSCSRRPRTRPRRSAGASSTRWPARARPCPSLPKKVRVSSLTFGEPADGRPALLDRLLLGNLHPLDRERARREARLRGAPRDACAARGSASSASADAVTLERFESLSPAERLAAPHAMPLSRVPFPFPRIQLASLEAWKIRRGQSVPARGVSAREGDWVTLVGPADDMLALGQVNPIGDRGVAMIKPRIVLA